MRLTIGLLLGAAIGAAVVHYLHTAEGRALVSKVKEDAEEMGDSISAIADDIAAKGKSLLGQKEEPENVDGILIVTVDNTPSSLQHDGVHFG